jgi:hypothetical protein
MESTESHKSAFSPFPLSLEIPSGLPHLHGLYDEKRYSEARAKTNPNFKLKPYHRKGLVMDVPGPKCNGCPGTLTSQEGLVSALGAAACLIIGRAMREGTAR